MSDDDGQQAFEHDMQIRREDEERAVKRVLAGTATDKDAEVIASGLGLDIEQLRRTQCAE